MAIKIWILGWLFASMVLVANGMPEDSEWELKKEAHGISVYTKSIPGTDLKVIKVYTNINTSLSSIIAILKDVPSFTSWVYICEQAKCLKNVSPTEEYYYIESEPPWPIRNRDVVVHSTFSQDPKTKVVTSRFVGIEDAAYPEVDGLVRITDMEGEYLLVPQQDGTVDIHYQLRVDPAGIIPAWLVNMTIGIGPYNSFLKLREMVMEEKYQRAHYDFIEEPYQ